MLVGRIDTDYRINNYASNSSKNSMKYRSCNENSSEHLRSPIDQTRQNAKAHRMDHARNILDPNQIVLFH